ncbi:LLM class flavin-dependent oxidoreductase [Domibacillus sp. DTU_2020_1001157_1_SI_ALB_TIR_016]|uniref:LLM class flavin-dependent oxidoreductase n=1 Tax=Domibacillus sp. DTU_2020_1001157_1_SI_ALB_TIR_016 TaxID=3077789 RepID=UPI0028EB70A5|nr:LLM class flavin-dependent oxidoreductase [Domibacillus sp. DTU_2020_1001157_1_SI_ALB_TIR_016]WNS78351.1 LLM class flavin-dependent oxidoreductase [Domibacillus sp. DTU_2020_1001157_1_SI_ALB_TIR_016]
MAKSMHLVLFATSTGLHMGGWRHPEAQNANELDIDFYQDLAYKAEAAKLDMLFVADKLAIDDLYGGTFDLSVTYRLVLSVEPITLISALSSVTKKIGLAATASTTYQEPYHIARMFSTLDHLSKGRVAWNMVTSTSDTEARNFGKTQHLDHSARYERATEFIEVVTSLWDSWEEDALILDKHEGVYARKAKVHYTNHDGKWFNVKGPLNVSRSPQGRPLIIQAGASEDFQLSASKNADLIFSVSPTLEKAKIFYDQFKEKVAANHRSKEDVKILPGLMPIVGRTLQEAKEKERLLRTLINPHAALSFMSGSMNYDLSLHDPDSPFPDILDKITGSRGRFEYVLKKAKQENLTLGEAAQWYAVSLSFPLLVGTPDFIAEELETWYKEEACDGFILIPPYMPGGLDDFLELVVPILQKKQIFRSDYTGDMLRDHLGLDIPRNRYS